MKTKISILFFTFFLLICNSLFANDLCENAKDIIYKNLPNIEENNQDNFSFNIIETFSHNQNFCEVYVTFQQNSINSAGMSTGDNIVPIFITQSDKKNKDSSIFVVVGGSVFNQKKDVSSEKISKIQKNISNKKDIKILKRLAPIVYKAPKETKRFVVLITDPFCSHCKKALEIAKTLNVNVYVLFKKLSGKSDNVIKEIICNNYSYDKYIQLNANTIKPNIKTCKRYTFYNDLSNFVFETFQLSINGVPYIITDTGLHLKGLNSQKLLEEYKK